MKIETLDYIVMTARFPTISIAAEKQFLSQTTLSSAIKSVENEVGFPIFERTPRGIALTAQGAEFVRLAEEVVHPISDREIPKKMTTPERAAIPLYTNQKDYSLDQSILDMRM